MKTILVVDDNPVQAYATLKLLDHRSVRILHEGTVEAGLDVARRETLDVILFDIETSTMDWLAVCRSLRLDKRTVKIPIILYASEAVPAIPRDEFSSDMLEFVVKDAFFEVVLLETLRHLHVIDRAHLRNNERRLTLGNGATK